VTTTVILGGAGFIGSHLCEVFLQRGDKVIAVDNLATGSRANIAHLGGQERFQFIEADIVKGIPVDEPVDVVLNFASPASPKDFTRLPIEILMVGAQGNQNALELARANNARFLIASTSEVYGDPLVNPQPEPYLGNVNSIGIRGVYDESKRYAEAMTMAYHRYRGVDTRILRIFNTYGPRMALDDGRALPNFICQAYRGDPVTIYGDGSQTRSFGFVDDLVAGAVALLDSDCHDPVNIGNPDEVSILDVAKEVIKEMGSNSELAFFDRPPGDPLVRCPVIDRARERLGWAPTVSRAEGLKKTIADFRGRLDALAAAGAKA